MSDIPYGELKEIRNSLTDVMTIMAEVDYKVNNLDNQTSQLHKDLLQLSQAFNDFIKKDVKEKRLQLAQTRLVTVRQELEQKFGFYNELRRTSIGILQAADLSLVKYETIANISDEFMILAPKYWLAAVLVAMSAWLQNNKELAERAIAEALQRDDEKSSLFFTLLMRRARRSQAHQVWLDRYLGMQNPEALDHEIIVVLNALVNGVFGVDTYTQCFTRIENWLKELTDKPGYVDKQRQKWEEALRSKIPPLPNNIYPYLTKYSPNWIVLSQTLREAKSHESLYEYFSKVFEGEIIRQTKFEDEIDQLLMSLVSKFDDEELPLKSEEHMQNLIIKHEGDKDQAQEQFKAEKSVFQDKISFTQILSNAAISPELTDTSLATQRLAIALSKDFITSAHNDLTAKNRSQVPQNIEIVIDDWKSSSVDGTNEAELVNDVESHYQKLKQHSVSQVKIKPMIWAYLIIGTLLFLSSITSKQKNYFLMLIGVGGGVSYLIAKKKNEAIILGIEEQYNQSCQKTKETLQATLAEVVDWRKDYAESDRKATQVSQLLGDITPEQYLLNPHGAARRLIDKKS